MNANSVPQALQDEFRATAERLSVFLHHVKTLPAELELCRRDFYAHLSRNWTLYAAAFKSRPDLEFIALADGVIYTARLHAILYELKAFLDLFARLITHLTNTTPGPNGFNKGLVGDRKLSGGNLINWIAGHSTTELPARDSLVQILTTASQIWITDAVANRDTLAHYRSMPGMKHMRVPVSQGPHTEAPHDIQPPSMPNGTELLSYVVQLRDQLCALVSDALPLVPQVRPKPKRTMDVCRSLP